MEKSLLERIEHVITFNEKCPVLSDWDIGFMESVAAFAKKRGKLSEGQYRVFAKLEAKCDPNVIEKAKAWESSWNDEKRTIARTCAEYYSNTMYWTALSNKILTDPEFIPSHRQYTKMCENKYAKKVLAITSAEPLYSIGATVVLRSPTANDWSNRSLRDVPCLVLGVLDGIVSTAKGAKQYSILPYGQAAPRTFEERQIKKWNGKKKTSKKSATCEEIPF